MPCLSWAARPFRSSRGAEIGVDRFPGGDVLEPVQHQTPCADGGGEQLGRIVLPLEDGDHAVLREPFSLPVAPASGLEDGVQPRSSRNTAGKSTSTPASMREVDTTRQGFLSSSRCLLSASPLSGGQDHKSRQVEIPLAGELMEYGLSRFPPIYHAQDLLLRLELPGQLLPGQLARPTEWTRR